MRLTPPSGRRRPSEEGCSLRCRPTEGLGTESIAGERNSYYKERVPSLRSQVQAVKSVVILKLEIGFVFRQQQNRVDGPSKSSEVKRGVPFLIGLINPLLLFVNVQPGIYVDEKLEEGSIVLCSNVKERAAVVVCQVLDFLKVKFNDVLNLCVLVRVSRCFDQPVDHLFTIDYLLEVLLRNPLITFLFFVSCSPPFGSAASSCASIGFSPSSTCASSSTLSWDLPLQPASCRPLPRPRPSS